MNYCACPSTSNHQFGLFALCSLFCIMHSTPVAPPITCIDIQSTNNIYYIKFSLRDCSQSLYLYTSFMQSKAMSALLCCGPCFDGQYLAEEGLIYHWLDSLLITPDEKVSSVILKKFFFLQAHANSSERST